MEEKNTGTWLENMVGVNFKPNPSLSERYEEYLKSSPLTSSPLLLTSSSCVVAKVAPPLTSLAALTSLSARHGFTRCSGRLLSMTHLSCGLQEFLDQVEGSLPGNTVVRTHAHPTSLASNILDHIHFSPTLAAKGVTSSPTQFTMLLVAVQLEEERVGWAIYTEEQYREAIARPGDGDALPEFQLNFNRAELKLAEACQLLTLEEQERVFPSRGPPLLAVDVGAAPGGWTGYLAALTSCATSVVAIDPAVLEESVAVRDNVRHLKHTAQDAVVSLPEAGAHLLGESWRENYRLLVCDANLDVRDCLRELVLPLASSLVPGGQLILTLKLGRRVGVRGVSNKVASAREMLENAGFLPSSFRVVWLFGNSKNERTIFATKL